MKTQAELRVSLNQFSHIEAAEKKKRTTVLGAGHPTHLRNYFLERPRYAKTDLEKLVKWHCSLGSETSRAAANTTCRSAPFRARVDIKISVGELD
jgi:hypothetical protein